PHPTPHTGCGVWGVGSGEIELKPQNPKTLKPQLPKTPTLNSCLLNPDDRLLTPPTNFLPQTLT
ncbi:MAG: hypothetical protein ACKPGF_24565, partial [Microcystis panniformis]